MGATESASPDDREPGVPPWLPVPDDVTFGYWEAAKRHELRIQRCLSCGRFQHFPAPVCSSCGSRDLRFDIVTGTGTVYSYIVVHHVVTPGFGDRAPYAVAWIELPEQAGLRVLSDLVECQPDEVKVGSKVEVFFDDATKDVTIPRFRLVRAIGPD